MAERIVFDVPARSPLQNTWQRMHWADRRKVCRQWAHMLFIAHPKAPRQPIARCVITIERFSTQKPDRDGRYGGVKPILDALQPMSRRHPYGLGFIADDNDDCITDLKVNHIQSREKRTRITIESITEKLA